MSLQVLRYQSGTKIEYVVSNSSRQAWRLTAFTLVELLIGMSLSLIIMTAVLSSYVFIGRSFTRSLGITSSNQPNLENQSRQTVTFFTQDARMAIGIAGTPTAPSPTSLILMLPSSAGTTTVTYTYDGAKTLTRTTSAGASQILHSNLLSFSFKYYDTLATQYDTSSPYYLPGIKLIAITFTAQAGSSTNQTLTQIYRTDSPRVLLRNRQSLYQHLSTSDNMPL